MPDPNQKLIDKLARRRKSVYHSIQAMQTASIRMIAEHMEVDRCQVTARLDELRDMGLVEFSHKELDNVTGITVSRWRIKKVVNVDPDYKYTIDGVPYTFMDFIDKAEEWGCPFNYGIRQTSVAAAYLRRIGHIVGTYTKGEL